VLVAVLVPMFVAVLVLVDVGVFVFMGMGMLVLVVENPGMEEARKKKRRAHKNCFRYLVIKLEFIIIS
jgi:hypothetical protein